MNIRSLFEQLLSSGREIANKGKDEAEERLGIPQEGPERDVMLSGMKKGAVVAGLLALLLGTGGGRRLGGTALKLGSLAAVGTLAYQAMKKWRAGRSAGSKPLLPEADDSIDRLSGAEAEKRSLSLLRALIAAAKADGHIDSSERARIHEQIGKLDLGSDTARLIQEEIAKPLDPKLVASLADSTTAAAEIYLASLLVIDVQDQRERAYLDELAGELGLAPEFVEQLESQAGDSA